MIVRRKVLAWEFTPRCECERLGARVTLHLECGHDRTLRASQAPVAKTRCPECEQLARLYARKEG